MNYYEEPSSGWNPYERWIPFGLRICPEDPVFRLKFIAECATMDVTISSMMRGVYRYKKPRENSDD